MPDTVKQKTIPDKPFNKNIDYAPYESHQTIRGSIYSPVEIADQPFPLAFTVDTVKNPAIISSPSASPSSSLSPSPSASQEPNYLEGINYHFEQPGVYNSLKLSTLFIEDYGIPENGHRTLLSADYFVMPLTKQIAYIDAVYVGISGESNTGTGLRISVRTNDSDFPNNILASKIFLATEIPNYEPQYHPKNAIRWDLSELDEPLILYEGQKYWLCYDLVNLSGDVVFQLPQAPGVAEPVVHKEFTENPVAGTYWSPISGATVAEEIMWWHYDY